MQPALLLLGTMSQQVLRLCGLACAAGELACFAVDEELALLCAATTHGQLLVYNLPSGRLLAAGRAAHVAATAVNKVRTLWREGQPTKQR
jgi:hypothetical protein